MVVSLIINKKVKVDSFAYLVLQGEAGEDLLVDASSSGGLLHLRAF